MDSKIDQEVIDELISMLEDHISDGMKPKAEVTKVEVDAEPEVEGSIPGVEPSEDDEDEDMRALMEMYSKG